ncbi:MAG: transporter family protein ATP-binding cassette, subfamily er 3 [Candidatus Nomurabacteria bacterium]|nr:transporter family protein ATP-binding cassette, subfamily er 3 [Candidatus Nomurabacteria bacterium]
MAVEKQIPSGGEAVLRFEDLSFNFGENKPILKETNFVVRKGTKLTLMGPNGSGKSTLFSLITKERKPEEGRILIGQGLNVAIAKQFIPHDEWSMTVREFLEKPFPEKIYDIDKRAKLMFETLKLYVELDSPIRKLSGGQKGRLLIAQALIQKPDILLLDEPTNNLDKAGVELLTNFMKNYPGTVIVISHDEAFLNSFTHGVLYINTQNFKVEQYIGNYYKVVEDIKRQVEREQRANSQLEKEIQENKDKVNFFAHKGGKMRKLAAKLKEEAEEMEENKVDVRKEDRTIRPFAIETQEDIGSVIVKFNSVEVLHNGKPVKRDVSIELRKGDKLHIIGPNGIGKTTLLEKIANRKEKGVEVQDGINIGYYRQDFSTLDFDKSSYEELAKVLKKLDDQLLRKTAASMLLGSEQLKAKIGLLSEGQKGLLMFAYLRLLKPGLLILDEPTNHINFRHIPVIAEALKNYAGPMIIVSHVDEFVKDIGVTETLDLGKL